MDFGRKILSKELSSGLIKGFIKYQTNIITRLNCLRSIRIPHIQRRQLVYTIIPSTVASSEYVIIGAHYDSYKDTPGADDNASGCALVYGLGKMLTQLETRSKNIILGLSRMKKRRDMQETGIRKMGESPKI